MAGHRRRSARPSSSKLSRSHIADSEDDCIELSSDHIHNISSRRTVTGVVIPTKQSIDGTAMLSKPSSTKRRSLASSLSSSASNSPFTRDNSDYDTAETSIESTPGPSATRLRDPFPKGHVFENPTAKSMKSKRKNAGNNNDDEAFARALQKEEDYPKGHLFENSTVNAGKGKRKRVAQDSDYDSDEALARALQYEEYTATDNKRQKLQEKPRKRESDELDDGGVIVDSDSDDEPLSTRLKRGQSKKKTAVTISSTTLPSRNARTSAIQSMKSNAYSVPNSEDDSDSDLSEYDEDPHLSPTPSHTGQHYTGLSEDAEDDDIEIVTRNYTRLPGETYRQFRLRQTRHRRGPNWEPRAVVERKKLEKAHPEILTMWDDLKAMTKIAVEQAEQPASINRTLKSFQLEGLNWMRKQEKTRWKGGLLGDEMGMGKTIQAVSLIMSDYPVTPHQPTLVVVPPVALMQWTNEIKEYTSGQLKVLVYHGSNAKAKKMTVKELKTYDVIMISYSGLESIYRKQNKGWTRDDQIIKEDSAMHAIHFHRLILDEAHSIKSRTAGVAKACFALKGTYRWCLSGTPVQNRIGEFFSLLRFLGITPFAHYFCKKCPCATMEWSTTGDYKCSHCTHRTLDHVSVFNQEILNPVVSGDTDAIRKLGLSKLRLLTDNIMLRRLKRDHTSSMELPPKEVIVHNEFFGEIERDFSSSIMSNTARQFDTYVSRGVMLNNYANIFGLIMQMRQVSDHPDLLLKRHAEAGQNVLVCNICDEAAEDAIRSRCKHDFCRVCVKDLMKTLEASGAEDLGCPRCHVPLAIDLDQPEIEQNEEAVKKSSIINRIKMENWTSSTKIEMLVYDLYKLRSKKQTLKSIVFSQFTSMLQLIEWRLRRAGFNTVMLDGSMTPQQRQRSIEYFMNNTDVEVFLVSLKAGGVALNLTEASRVFIVDPWWNPAAEWQSADRCHRIGQKRPCVITRLCIEDSVESRIVMLQEKKANLINGTVNNDEVAMDKLSPEDMQFLFRGS